MYLLTQYFDLQEQVHKYFGYIEDWVVIPINDERESYWYLEQQETGSGTVYFSPRELTPESIKEGNFLYANAIYTQRFLPRWVYRAEDYTMICVDTQTDGNKFLSVFDNTRELKNPSPEQLEAFELW